MTTYSEDEIDRDSHQKHYRWLEYLCSGLKIHAYYNAPDWQKNNLHIALATIKSSIFCPVKLLNVSEELRDDFRIGYQAVSRDGVALR